MESNWCGNKSFKILTFTVGGLLAIFLIFAVLVKGHDTVEAFSHATLPQKTIDANGEAQITATPDLAYLQFTISSRDSDYTGAETDLNKSLQTFSRLLSTQGINPGNITVNSQTFTPPGEGDETGFTGSEDLTVKVSDGNDLSQKINAIFNGAAKQGLVPNESTQSCLTFQNIDAVLKPALRQALQKAQAQAQQLANLGGFKLGPLVGITDDSDETYSPKEDGCVNVAIPDMAINPQEVTASVSTTYEIK